MHYKLIVSVLLLFLLIGNASAAWTDDYSYRKLMFINQSDVLLTDYQIKAEIPYVSFMQSDMDDIRFTNYTGTNISYWFESVNDGINATVWLNVTEISNTSETMIWMYYGNSTVGNASNGPNTFLQWHGSATANYHDSNTVLNNIIYESKIKVSGAVPFITAGVSKNVGFGGDSIYFLSDGAYRELITSNTAQSKQQESPSWPTDTYIQLKFTFDGSTVHGYVDSDEIGTGITTNLPNENMGLGLDIFMGTTVQDWSFVRTYTPNEPTWTTGLVAPYLISPSNLSTIDATYPPLTGDSTFTWENLDISQYRLMVAEDVNFNMMHTDVHIGVNYSTQSLLVDKTYWWKVYNYNGSAYSNASDVWSFNLTGNSSLTGSAIEGVVYADIDGTFTALSGAEVLIWNTTWSDTLITGSNGYYVFPGVAAGQVYSVQAKKDLYLDSSVALVNTTSDPETQNFLLLPDRTSEEWRHFVKFTVQNVWGTKYPNVDVTVYENHDVTSLYTATTGTDGSVTFIMDRDQEYRLTFINSTQGIDHETTLYPKETHYLIWVTTLDLGIPDTTYSDVRYYWSDERINSTHAYINFTWTDTSGSSTDFTYWINDSDNGPLAGYPVSSTTTNFTNSTIVPASSDRYYVHVIADHPTWGEIESSDVIFFGGRMIDLGWSETWHYSTVAFCAIVFVGLLAGAVTAHYMAVVCVMLAWFFKWIGWIDNSSISTLLLILATVVAFGFAMRKGEVVKV